VIKKTIKIFFKLPESIRYILVGGFNTVFAIFLFAFLYFILKDFINYLVVFYLSSIISISVSCINLKYFVFLKKGEFKKHFSKSFIVQVTSVLLNSFLLKIAVDGLHYHPVTSQIILSLLIAFATYFAHKFFSFKD